MTAGPIEPGRRRARGLQAAALLLGAACHHGPGPTAAGGPKENDVEPIPLDALMTSGGDARFVARLADAQAIFVGELVSVGPAPGAFSGYRAAMQALSFRVESVLRGAVDQPSMTVHHLIVSGSPALDDGRPALRPDLVRIGDRYIVAVGGTVEGKRVTANENVPPIAATAENVARVEAALR